MDKEKTQTAAPATPTAPAASTAPAAPATPAASATPAPNPVLEKLPAPPDKNRTADPTPPPSAPDDAAAAATSMVEAPAPAPAATPATPAPEPAPVANTLSNIVDKLKDSFKVDVTAEKAPEAPETPKTPEVAEETSAPSTAEKAPEPPKPTETPAAAAIEAALATAPPSPTSSAWGKTPCYKKPFFIGLVCILVGLGLGAGAVYLVNQSNDTSTPCPACNCESAGSTATTVVENTSPITAFLSLEPQNKNLLYSPLAIQYGLATLSTGASGTTKSQIDNILSSAKFPSYPSLPDNLSVANAFVAKTTYRDMLLPSFTSAVQKSYHTEILYDELKNTVSLDTWMKNKTFGLVDSLDIALDSSMESVLMSSLAMQADWQSAFNPAGTTIAPFYLSDGSEVNAATMNAYITSGSISYNKSNSSTLLSLPLQTSTSGPNLDFVVIMPETSLSTYVKNLNLEAIESAISSATTASQAETGVLISLPKFKLDYTLSFVNDLELLGITDAFSTDSASFSNITSLPEGIHLGTAVHKNSLAISENGLNYAADLAEGAGTTPTTGDNPNAIAVNINRPFLFLIRDRDNSAIWMIGTLYEPAW